MPEWLLEDIYAAAAWSSHLLTYSLSWQEAADNTNNYEK